MKISNPATDCQKRWNELCDLGGGQGGGPARGKVQDLLHEFSLDPNSCAETELGEQLELFSDRNPWHVCFAFGLGWGHLAKIDRAFTGAATSYLEEPEHSALETACKYHLERGKGPIEASLIGGHTLFGKVKLPEQLPDSLSLLGRCQERWISPIQSKDRPRYIGAWNATAMFMMALFAKPELGKQLLDPTVQLPPGGPIYRGLNRLHKAHLLPRPPAGTGLDDEAFEPGAIYENNHLFTEILKGHAGWSLMNVHTGLYQLGTGERQER